MPEIISEVTDMIEAAENSDVKVNWIDRVIGKTLKERDHHKLIKTANSLMAWMEEN